MPAQLPEGLPPDFRVRDGIARGVSVDRMRGADLARPHWGIRSVVLPSTPAANATAFAPRMPPRAFLFGLSAAAVHGMPLPWNADLSQVHVGVRAGTRRIDSGDVRAHHVRIDPLDIGRIGGIAITTPERTWCDLGAGGLTMPQLVAAGDFLLWHRGPRSSATRLAIALRRYDGRRGALLLHRSLALLDGRSDSAPESEIRIAILEAGLPAPRVNMPVHDARGHFVAQPDLTWPDRKIALEYEGDHHRTDKEQWHRDIERYARLQELGWAIIRATAADYRNPARLLARLTRLLPPSP